MARFHHFIVVYLSCTILNACSFLWTSPNEATTQERFAVLPSGPAPVKAPLMILWNQHAVPYVEAQDDGDAAFGLGLVQAHLRLGQIELLRIVSQGRISEIAGPLPFIKTVDHGLRMLDLRRAAETSLRAMAPGTRHWVDRFVEGINWYQRNIKQPPLEHRLFGLELEDFSTLDIMTIGRLASADLNWGLYTRFLKLAEDQDWRKAFELMLEKQDFDVASFESTNDFPLIQLIRDMTRSGSNSIVIQGNRSASGSALIANDPHVGIFLPNFWFLAGIKSPSHHVVGLMIPGLPFFGIGRNPDIAWGGTNMRAISTHLFDVSTLPPEQKVSRRERLKRRWWIDSEIEIRDTPFGPIFTDLDYFDRERQPFEAALQWIGHEPSDEVGSFLAAQRAKNWDQFVQAFHTYRVSAMNLVYADRQGHIGMLPAYGQAVLREPNRTLELVKSLDNPIVGVLPPTELPRVFDPPLGVIASANNKPYSRSPIPLAFAFANNDRHDRMIDMLADVPKILLTDLARLQQDVFSPSAFSLKESIARRIAPIPGNALFEHFRTWDGHYRAESRNAVAFEILMYYAWQEYIREQPEGLRDYLASYDGWKPLLQRWLQPWDAEHLSLAVQRWLIAGEDDFTKVPNWGAFHVQEIQHPLGAIPWLGQRFKRAAYGESGGNDTLFKTGRPFSPKPATVTYGASARHISDLADPDANYFVLKGGQDGWLNNPQLDDQVTLWREGRYIQMPLNMDRVREQFRTAVTHLSPEGQ